MKLDFWKTPSRVNEKVDIMISPDIKIELEEKLKHYGISSAALLSNVGE